MPAVIALVVYGLFCFWMGNLHARTRHRAGAES